MVVSKPNKKFLYYEDNGDGTCTVTISIPDHEIFSTAIVQMSLDDMFSVGASVMSPELHQEISDITVIVPDSLEEA